MFFHCTIVPDAGAFRCSRHPNIEIILQLVDGSTSTPELRTRFLGQAKVALAAVKGDRTLAQLAEQFDGEAADVFGPGGGNAVRSVQKLSQAVASLGTPSTKSKSGHRC